MGALSVVADVTYTVADNDLESNTAIDKVDASLDSTNLSVGVTGQYQLDFNGTTGACLRYSSIKNYSIGWYSTYTYFNTQSMDVFSLYMGVTFAKEFTADAWMLKLSHIDRVRAKQTLGLLCNHDKIGCILTACQKN